MKNKPDQRREMNLICLSNLRKRSEHFVFMYDDSDESLSVLLQTFRKFALDPEINFTQ